MCLPMKGEEQNNGVFQRPAQMVHPIREPAIFGTEKQNTQITEKYHKLSTVLGIIV